MINNLQTAFDLNSIPNVTGKHFPIQILKYMGNKSRLLKWLNPLLKEELNYGDSFLDLFAGTSSVGYSLKERNRIVANDIQEYSTVISRALLEFNGRIRNNDFTYYLEDNYQKNIFKLFKEFKTAIAHEEQLIFDKNVKDYKKFLSMLPRYGEIIRRDPYGLKYYYSEEFIEQKRKNNKTFPYLLFTIYYTGGFFSLRQGIEVDSLRYAIDRIRDKGRQAVYLSCLISATSKAVSSSGHFAEYLNIESPGARNFIIENRKVSIVKEFVKKLNEFKHTYIQKDWKNKVYNYDYKTLIKKLSLTDEINNIKLIYVDPPYTAAQYSRFYHIPETLVKYDYPVLTKGITSKFVKGRYRIKRHQSPFSQASKVEDAFREMFDIISTNTNATLAVSYSDNSILRPVDKLIKIAQKYYNIIDKKNGYSHSAQGSKFKRNGQGRHIVNEYLLICKKR